MSVYSQFSVRDLQRELKLRNAKVTGRKSELIERLECYDRNFNFGNDLEPATQKALDLPATNLYRDVNSSCVLPTVSNFHILSYLKMFEKDIDDKANQMYFGKYLVYVRWCETGNIFYVKASCKAEFKKNTRYTVDICLKKHGEVISCQCECAVGSAPTAHCKHVIAVLIGIASGHPILTLETCTQQIQKFHKPLKKFTASPVKSRDIPIERYNDVGVSNCIKSTTFDPRPKEFINHPGYNDYVRNLTVGSSIGQAPMPLLQLFEPANPYSIENDHDYCKDSPSSLFLKRLKVTEIGPEDRSELERETRFQRKSKRWGQERAIRLQSSNFGIVCKGTDKLNKENLANRLCNPRPIKAKSIIHGQVHEDKALNLYEEVTGNKVKKCGIVLHNTYPYLGTSPDAVVIGQDKIVEVKCPYVVRNMLISPETVPYLEICSGELKLKSNHNYMYQIQGQLEITNKSECDLVIYTFKDFKILNISRDRVFFERMLPKLLDFFLSFQMDAVLKKFYYRDYELFSFCSSKK